MQFHAEIELSGKTATGVAVPPEVVSGLGGSKRPAVKATINGYTYRTSIASMGGRFMLPISAQVRANAGVADGDVVAVSLVLDTDPREVEVPADLLDALGAATPARVFFDGLSYSNKLRLVLAITDAKSAETRRRRIDKTVESLAAGRS
jgi:Domain of unknown function (DUF1905)/Bacteriocin-protection, YdeI or OmpD-Associated